MSVSVTAIGFEDLNVSRVAGMQLIYTFVFLELCRGDAVQRNHSRVHQSGLYGIPGKREEDTWARL